MKIWEKIKNSAEIPQISNLEYVELDQFCFTSFESEQRIIFCYCNNRKHFSSIFDFAFSSLYLIYKLDKEFISPDHTWPERINIYRILQLNNIQFVNIFNEYTEQLNKPFPISINLEIVNAYSLLEEWNYKVCIAETISAYYCFLWETGA